MAEFKLSEEEKKALRSFLKKVTKLTKCKYPTYKFTLTSTAIGYSVSVIAIARDKDGDTYEFCKDITDYSDW